MRQSLSFRAKILLFTAALSILPFAVYGVWTYQSHSEALKEQEQQTQSSYAMLIANSINIYYYGYVNEQLQTLTQLRREMARIADSMNFALENFGGSRMLSRHLQSLSTGTIHTFIYNRRDPERSFNMNERTRDLLHAADMRGQTFLQHVRADVLSQHGYYFLIEDSLGHTYLTMIRPAVSDSRMILCAVAQIDAVREAYNSNAQYGLLESFNLLIENIPPALIGDVFLLDHKHQLLSTGVNRSHINLSQLPQELFDAAYSTGQTQGLVLEPEDIAVQINYIKSLDWYLVLAKPVSLMENHLIYSAFALISFCIIFAVGGIAIALLITHDIRRRLEMLTEAAAKVTASGPLDAPEKLLHHARYFDYPVHDESRAVFHAIKRMIHALYRQTSRLVHRVSRQKHREGFVEAALAVKRDQLMSEQELAAFTMGGRMQISYYAHTCPEAGGDFYDVQPVDDDQAILILGTASGEDIRAAAAVTMILALLRQFLQQCDLTEAAWRLHLALRTYRRHDRAALFMGQLNLSTGRLTYINAGLCRPWVLRADGTLEQAEAGQRTPLGFHGEKHFTAHELTLHAGDVLLFYSQGLLDVENSDGERFGQERLADLLRRHYRAHEAAADLLAKVEDFRGPAPVKADISVLSCTFKPQA